MICKEWLPERVLIKLKGSWQNHYIRQKGEVKFICPSTYKIEDNRTSKKGLHANSGIEELPWTMDSRLIPFSREGTKIFGNMTFLYRTVFQRLFTRYIIS